ncbi:hypothetical protein ACIRRA_15810 [Nocardia sp. NPDC101769]|uniref:hypothetical protein n=1 Tax=Nocardia sp. NPDC101769 TaxID=3364333 RepID=UPI003804C7B1
MNGLGCSTWGHYDTIDHPDTRAPARPRRPHPFLSRIPIDLELNSAVDGPIRVRYRTIGTGPDLLLVHVLMTTSYSWLDVLVDLTPSGAITLRPTYDKLVGPEIATLAGFVDRAWMCWRPGEAAFEYIH